MTTFLQLHLLTSYPPSNPNRDDLGRPKTATFGGTTRQRISSQSLKRTWRTSSIFDSLREGGHMGTRSRATGPEIYDEMVEAGINEEKAHTWSGMIAGAFAKRRKVGKSSDEDKNKRRELETEQLIILSHVERAAISELIEQLASEDREPSKDELKGLLLKDHKASDIAMFGRMLADNPSHNVEAAVQVAHALTTHPVAIEDDYFSAVDELNKDDAGAGHIGEASFSAGIFYVYVNVNEDLLLENLHGDRALAASTIEALCRAVATETPTGKQASYGSRCYAHYVLAERGTQAPRQLSLAFLPNQFNTSDPIADAVKKLEKTRVGMDRAYGKWASSGARVLDVLGKGDANPEERVEGIDQIAAFARGDQ